jgi:hypothetical protein
MTVIKKSLEDVLPNEYEAVLVAAKLARRLNSLRLAAKEQLPPEEYHKIDARKVTSQAMDELMEEKVKFARPDAAEEEESFDLT